MSESLQELATDIEELADRTYPVLPEDHIRNKGGKAFTDGVEDRPRNERRDILGEPIVLHRAKRPKTIGVLELWETRPLPS
jgi:hypothetical protein